MKTNGSKEDKKPLFSLGRVVSTVGAYEAIEKAGQTPKEFLDRHITGDWGELDEHDRKENEKALEEDLRIFSAYKTNDGKRIWVITEWDRSMTTILLPEEY